MFLRIIPTQFMDTAVSCMLAFADKLAAHTLIQNMITSGSKKHNDGYIHPNMFRSVSNNRYCSVTAAVWMITACWMHEPHWGKAYYCSQPFLCLMFSEMDGLVDVCSWAEWLIQSWTSGRSSRQTAIIWTGLTGLFRGAPSKNTSHLCDSMMMLTTAAAPRSPRFCTITSSLPFLCQAFPLSSFDQETSLSAFCI